ncbi:MAG: PEPxxWA-CTERM sorting domain-containing protein [Luteimonas sp.]|nr:PEPxxWA-CTERM sorting domain-containing protein [Luteimonas sp.]
MKLLNRIIATTSVCAVGLFIGSVVAYAQSPQDTLFAYGAALNDGNARAAADVFSINAIFSQAGAPVVNGRENIFANFEGLFSAVSFDLSFTILDLSSLGDLAYVWSRSDGEIQVGGAAPMPASFRELFIMERGATSDYLIDQYYFAPAGVVPNVPEPTTWLMLTAGLGLIGAAVRRRALHARP